MNLLVLGDSLSDGGWERDPAGIGSAWPAGLSRLVAASGRNLSVTNRSRGGARSVDVLEGYAGSDWTGFDAVAVFAGANDLWRRWVPWNGHAAVDSDDYGRNLAKICRIARSRGASQVWILTPCLLHADPDHPWNAEMSEYRGACAKVARDEHALLVPTGEEFEAATRALPEVKWTYDGVHPRPVGQERLAWTVYHHAMHGDELTCDQVPVKPSGHRLGAWP